MNPSLTQDWQSLLSLALLGTGRATDDVPELFGASKTANGGEDIRERQALLAAGTLSIMRKAGYKTRGGQANSAWLPHAPEDIPLLGTAGQEALQQLISQRQANLLEPYLEQLQTLGLRISEKLILPLMDLAGSNAYAKKLVLTQSGQRGRWLAERLPEWASLIATQNLEDTWHHGTATQRRDYLFALRASDPEKARELFQTAQEESSAKEIVQLMEALSQGLSAADIPLLEPLLKAKSKEVRRSAAQLLVLLPAHPLAHVLFERAKPLLQLKGNLLMGKRLEVELPAAYDPAWQAEGIEPKSARFPSERGGWLGQMLALIPPALWSQHFQTEPEKLVAYAAKSEFANILLPAWSDAAVLHKEAPWLEALLNHEFDKNNRESFYTTFPSQSLRQLPSVVVEPVMLRQMAKVTDFSAPQLLQLHFGLQADPWSVDFTQKTIAWLAKVIGKTQKQYATYSPVIIIINQFSLAAHPSCADQFKTLDAALTSNDVFTPKNIQNFEEVRATLLLRKKLDESL